MKSFFLAPRHDRRLFLVLLKTRPGMRKERVAGRERRIERTWIEQRSRVWEGPPERFLGPVLG